MIPVSGPARRTPRRGYNRLRYVVWPSGAAQLGLTVTVPTTMIPRPGGSTTPAGLLPVGEILDGFEIVAI